MKVTAAKYLTVFLTQMKNLTEYRINVALKLIRPLLMTAVIGSLWLVLFRLSGRQEIGGFNRQSFIIYILVVRFIAVFSPGGACITEMNEEICTGNLTMRMVRPMHYLSWLLARSLPVPLVSGIIGLVLVTVFAIIIRAVVPTGVTALLFILSVIAAIITQYALYQGIGILSFWIYEVFPIERFMKLITGVLSGELLPLTIFGGTAQIVLQFLPFASLAFNPSGIYSGLFTDQTALKLVAVQYLWAIALWALVLTLYQKGLRRFEAQGG